MPTSRAISLRCSSSFRTRSDYLSDNPLKLPTEPTLENYGTVFDPRRGNYLVYIWNSFFVAFMATALSLVLAVPAAYAMSRFLMNKSAMVVLLARIIPGVSLLVPRYFILSELM